MLFPYLCEEIDDQSGRLSALFARAFGAIALRGARVACVAELALYVEPIRGVLTTLSLFVAEMLVPYSSPFC